MQKALVVDDCATNRIILQKRLEKLSIEVVTASSGAEALQAFQQDVFPIVFLDIQMPEMDGFTVVRRLREMNADVPFIAWTCSVEASADDLKSLGFADVLDKPLTTVSFQQVIQRYFGVGMGTSEEGHDSHGSLQRDLQRLDFDPGIRALQLRQQMNQSIAEVCQALDENDWDEAKFLVRRLRGAMKVAGLPHLAAQLKALELTCDLREEALFS